MKRSMPASFTLGIRDSDLLENDPSINQKDSQKCPICKSDECISEGRIYHRLPTVVAGVPVQLPSDHYELIGCQACGFKFKAPSLDPEILLKCYSQASGVYWDERPDPHERRFDLIRRMLVTHADGRRILDVGCFNGAFLEFLGPEWDRFGIEPGNEASSLARARGVTIVAPTLDMLPSATGPFDSVIAIDVVEHVVDPLTFFRAARRVLNPNGVLIIVTGDTAARTWRWERARYWYCSIPEHLSFFSHRTVEWVATELGMQCVEFHRSCHQRWPIRTKIRQAANNVAYLTCLRSKGFGIAPLYRAVVNRPAPAWITANDHMFCAMKCV